MVTIPEKESYRSTSEAGIRFTHSEEQPVSETQLGTDAPLLGPCRRDK